MGEEWVVWRVVPVPPPPPPTQTRHRLGGGRGSQDILFLPGLLQLGRIRHTVNRQTHAAQTSSKQRFQRLQDELL
jgi:hypothetical protein